MAKALARRASAPLRHFNVSEAWSTATPGPMVELIETFCR
jgi:hypothetical protein